MSVKKVQVDVKKEYSKICLISILFSETCTELEWIWPLMIVLLAIISLLVSDQSLKFSTVEAGEFVGGVETVKIRKKISLSVH